MLKREIFSALSNEDPFLNFWFIDWLKVQIVFEVDYGPKERIILIRMIIFLQIFSLKRYYFHYLVSLFKVLRVIKPMKILEVQGNF